MKYAVISDIHGNLEALNAVLDRAYVEKVDKYICVGDIVGYNANPVECLTTVQLLDLAAIVRGNHDEFVGSDESLEGFNPTAEKSLMWTREQLTSVQRDWLKCLSLKVVNYKDNITVVHATLDSPATWGYVCDLYHAKDNFSYQMTQLCFCGHSHVPILFRKGHSIGRCSASMTEVPEWGNISEHETEFTVKLDFGCKYLVNVGSIGQPRNGDPRASFVIYDSNKRFIKRICVEYDISTAQKKIRKAGLPEKLASRLEFRM